MYCLYAGGTMAKPRFLNTLQVKQLPNERWEITQPLTFYSSFGFISIPAGFDTDFCSIPRIPIVYSWLGNRFQAAGAVHDYIYRFKMFPRSICDDILAEAAAALGATGLEQNTIWLGVRSFGWMYYGKKK